jgi:hypothetical protein
VVEPGRRIISTVTTTHSRLNIPVYMASGADIARAFAGVGVPVRAARMLPWRGSTSSTSTPAATAVNTMEMINQASPRTRRRLAVANPNTGTTMPTVA